MRRQVQWLWALFTFCLVTLSALSSSARAGNVADVVRDLYGGDGITLEDVGGPFSHTAHFTAASLESLDDLSSAINSSAGIFSFNSTVTGFTFDIERGVPVRTTESLGPLLAERAPTLGKNKLSFAFSYTRIKFDKLEGDDLDDLELIFQHDDVNGDGVLGPLGTPLDFELDQVRVDLDLELEQDLFVFFATYGLGRHWDIGAVVPIVRTEAHAKAQASVVENAVSNPGLHRFDPVNQDAPADEIERDATGLGDVILRSKYNFLRKHPRIPDLAALGQVKLATGDEDDLMGTGETNVLALLIASRTLVRFTPHVNLGYEWSSDSELSNVRYVGGFDYALHSRLTVAADLLGRWEPEGDDVGDHTLDLALGAKWNPIETLIFSGNVLFPLNPNEGLRADVIWSLGVEMTF